MAKNNGNSNKKITSDAAARNAKPGEIQYRLTVGQGLYLLVMPSGQKYWRLDYSFHGRRKTFAIGAYPAVSLKDAKKKRDDAKAMVADGVDPVFDRQTKKAAGRESSGNTFGKIAEDWFALQSKGWVDSHAVSVRARLNTYILPLIGNTPISDITAMTLLPLLRRIERQGKVESAKRVRVILSQVFRHALAIGLVDRDPAADLKGVLAPAKPKPMAAITDPVGIAGLLKSISGYSGDIITRVALRLSALLFVRPGELRHMEWSEIDWDRSLWHIPASKMKADRNHTVPLAKQTLELLKTLRPLTGEGRYVFPSMRSSRRPMSENTVLAALRRMGYSKEEMTPHGFRSMASTTLHESGWDHEIIELQLAHGRRDKVAAAYDRSRRLPERIHMMQWYANFLDALETNKSPNEIVREIMDNLTAKSPELGPKGIGTFQRSNPKS